MNDKSGPKAALETPAKKSTSSITAADDKRVSAAPRPRRTKREMDGLREALYAIVARNRPCSVRQVYYVGIGTLWEKDTGTDRTAYNDVVRNLGVMRDTGMLPWGWLTDSTRYVRIATMYDSLDDALARMHEQYRRNIWATQSRRVEVWAESDSTSSLVQDVTMTLGVGLYSCKGQAGKEFVHSAAMAYMKVRKPVTVLYLGDWDPSGLAIPRSLRDRLEHYTGGAIDIEFRRLAVTPSQIAEHNLQTHQVNTNDSSFPRFAADCRLVGLAEQDAVEVEAFAPPVLRNIVETELYALVENAEGWNATLGYEEAEREQLRLLAVGGLR